MEKGERRREVPLFFLVTIVITWLLWAGVWLSQRGTLSLPAEPLLRFGTFTPTAIGLIFAFRSGGKPEVRRLLASLFDPYIKVRWLTYIFGVPFGVSALSCLIFVALGGSLPKAQVALPFIPFAFIYVLVFLGPLGEEAGWRGLALKRLLKRLAPMKAALLLGAVWAVWHLPLFFIEGTAQHALAAFGLPATLVCYLIYTLMISILITLVYVMTNENTLTALLFHTAANLSLGIVPLIFIKSGAAILLVVLGTVTAGYVYAFKKILFCEAFHEHSDN